jgi:nitrate/nitrite-specific signal transduction histidine kinase
MRNLRSNRYVERVREVTRALFEDLLEANRRLCLSVAVMSSDRDLASPEDLNDLNKRSERWRSEQQSVFALLEGIEREQQRFQEQFCDIERQNANLAALYAAGHALHTSSSRESALAAVEEIVINLVGSEQFAIVSGDEQLTPQALFGIRAQELLGLTGESGIIGRARSERRPLALLRGMPADATRVRACIPLQLAKQTRGFVLIFGFLPQKDELSPLDYELFSLIGTQAAAALLVGDALADREQCHAQ